MTYTPEDERRRPRGLHDTGRSRVPARGVVLGIIVAVLFAGYAGLTAARPHAVRGLRMGRLTDREVRRRAEGLTALLAPDVPEYRLLVEPGRAGAPGTAPRCWYAEALDPNGKQVAGYTWDADTGALVQLCRRPIPAEQPSHALSRGEMVQTIGYWLKRLAIELPPQPWRLRDWAKKDDLLYAYLASGDERGAVTMEAGSGRILSYVRSRRRR